MSKNLYSTDGKVKTFSTTEDDINIKLAKIIGQKFIDYRKRWDLANQMKLVTDFPMFLHLDIDKHATINAHIVLLGLPKKLKSITVEIF